MDLERVMESAEVERAARASARDMAIRGSVQSQSIRAAESSTPTSLIGASHDAQRSGSPSDVWAGAIARLQTQVSSNTSMLQAQHRQVADVVLAVTRLRQEMDDVIAAIMEVRQKLITRPVVAERVEHGDFDVLVDQMASVTNKANEVDGLRMQIDLMRNRMKRLEEQTAESTGGQRPGTSSPPRERSFYPSTVAQQLRMQPPQPQSLPPMRTSSLHSPDEERRSVRSYPQAPFVPSQSAPIYQAPFEPRPLPADSSLAQIPAAGPGFRPVEPLPAPAVLSGWRPAEHQPATAPHQAHPQGPLRLTMAGSEPQGSGWAAVNLNQATKRPFEEPRPSPYDSPSSGSPKRPRLAPIMPRNEYGEEGFVQIPSSYQQPASAAMPDVPFYARSRAPSDSEYMQSQSQGLPTPAPASANAYRFVTSTGPTEGQDFRRPDAMNILPTQSSTGGRSRGKPRGGRNRSSRGGRGGAAGQILESDELGTQDQGQVDWASSQMSPNGNFAPWPSTRGSFLGRSDSFVGGPSETPITPIQGPYDPFAAAQADSGNASGSKKSRTKPIRNAEGVLIRKDGRPDMRSVSSANNLRKVHAKKEAERNAEVSEGHTPTSPRSLAPAHSNSMSDEPEEGSHSVTPTSADGEPRGYQANTQDRHQQLMGKIFPYGIDAAGDQYVPPREEPASASDSVMKIEEGEGDAGAARRTSLSGSQKTDVVMREGSQMHGQEREESLRDAERAISEEQPSAES